MHIKIGNGGTEEDAVFVVDVATLGDEGIEAGMHLFGHCPQLRPFTELDHSRLNDDSTPKQANAGKCYVHPKPYVLLYIHAI